MKKAFPAHIICVIADGKPFDKEVSGMGGTAETIFDPASCADMVLACITAISAATDLYCGKIFNMITLPGLCVGVVLAFLHGGAAGVLDVLCAVGFTVVFLIPFYRAGGLGAGDIKLLAAVSAFMPAGAYLRCFAGAFIIGACIGIGHLMLSGGRDHRVHFAVSVAASVLLHLAGIY